MKNFFVLDWNLFLGKEFMKNFYGTKRWDGEKEVGLLNFEDGFCVYTKNFFGFIVKGLDELSKNGP